MGLINSTIVINVSVAIDTIAVDTALLTSKFVPKKCSNSMTLFYLVISSGALGLMAGAVYQASSAVLTGFGHWAAYLDPQWAHQARLIEILINFVLMIWVAGSGLFWGGWLLHRSIRKLRGLPWSLGSSQRNPKKKESRFFPPVMRYLQLSCFFLMTVLLTVLAQYPLQYIY